MKRLSALCCLVYALAAGSVASLGGCLGWDEAKFQMERTSTVPASEPMPVRVKSENGSITLSASQQAEVEIVAHIRATTQERLDQVKVNAARDASGTFIIDTSWPPPGRKGNEGVDFVVKIPATTQINLDTSNGSIGVEGLAGKATLHTSNGKITVQNHDGEIDASTSNGAIKIDGASAPVKARTSNGSITVASAPTFPGPVNAHSSNGSITVRFGPAFAGDIAADTSNGRITITDPTAAKTLATGKGNLSWQRGQGPRSVLETSNGSINVEVAPAQPAPANAPDAPGNPPANGPA